MATSGSTDFRLNGGEIVAQAYGLLGMSGDLGEAITAGMIATGLTALNMMVKGWQADGLQPWRTTEGNFALVAGTASYTLGTGGTVAYRPVDLLAVRYRTSANIDTPMRRLSRTEYFGLSNKAATGIPNSWYYDAQRDPAVLYVWPALQAGVTGSTLRITYERSVEDFDATANDADFPPEWTEALVYGLAVRLAPRFGPSAASMLPAIAPLAADAYTKLKMFTAGRGEVTFEPDWDEFRLAYGG